MALPRFPRPKSFHVDYCGCTAAPFLMNESSVQDAIIATRLTKSKRDFIKATVSTAKDGVKIVYENKEKYSTHVPAIMIACATVGKASFQDTVGVVYISPLTGRHYPAFIHIYRCDSSRTAQKLHIRLQFYTSTETHRSDLLRLEKQLIEHKLLTSTQTETPVIPDRNINSSASNSNPTNTDGSSSSASTGSRPERNDPIRSITEELKEKINSEKPLLFPPKDYDTVHANHGNIRLAQSRKSTQPNIVGVISNNETSHVQKHDVTSNQVKSTFKPKHNGVNQSETRTDPVSNLDGRSRLSTQKHDLTIDPVEAVSLAFEFLKDETDSIFNDEDTNLDHADTQPPEKPPIFRFRPAPMPPSNSNRKSYDLLNNGHHSKQPFLNNGIDTYYNNAHYHHQLSHGFRNGSEPRSDFGLRPGMHLSPRYENPFNSRSGAPIPTNPVWTGPGTNISGSQPNLLSPDSSFPTPVYRHLSPQVPRRVTDVPLQHPLYAMQQNNRQLNGKPFVLNPSKRPAPAPPIRTSPNEYPNRRQTAHYPYFQSNEFILRASDNQIFKDNDQSDRQTSDPSKDFVIPMKSTHAHSSTMLDVYY